MKIPAIATFLLCFTLLWAACQPPSNNNVTPTNPGNPNNPGTPTFHVSAPASGTLPHINQSFDVNDSDFLTIIMTVTNPQAGDTVRYSIIEPGKDFMYLEKSDSVATRQPNDTGYGVGNFQRHIAFTHKYLNYTDTTEEIKVAFWNAQHRDTATILIHINKTLGLLKLPGISPGIHVGFFIKSFITLNSNGFECYIESPGGFNYDWVPSWARGQHNGGKDIEIIGATFYPPLSTTPVIYTHSSFANLQSGGIPKFYMDANGAAFNGTGFGASITKDTGVGQIMAWWGPQGPIIHVIPNVVLYDFDPASQYYREIEEFEFLY